MNTRSITIRLVSWYIMALGVAGASFALFTYFGFQNYVDSVLKNTLRSRAEDVASLAAPLLDRRQALADLIETRFLPEAHGRFIRVIVNGEIIYASSRPAKRDDAPGVIPTDLKPGLSILEDLYVYDLRQAAPDGRTVVVQSGQSAQIVRTARGGLVHTMVWALPLLLIIAAAGAYGLVRQALRPVTAMTAAVRQISPGELHRRLDVPKTGDVIEELGRTLNAMLTNLEAAYLHASRFSADAAHEMRTPLATIRGELERVLLKAALDPEVCAAVENASEETHRLQHILDNLLQLEVLDYGADKTSQRVDLRELCGETIDQLQLLANEHGMSLVAGSLEAAVTRGDRQQLKQVLVNLVDNAFKYSRVGDAIVIDCRRNADTSEILVADQGVGIAPADQERIFDRFYRAGAENGVSGAGLGLSIVKAICQAHGGAVAVDSKLGRGSRFIVSLPAG